MLTQLRRLLFGSPLPTWRAIHERLPKVLALPILASDALSSVAYASEEMLLILLVAGTAIARSPILVYASGAIVILLAIVATSYRQTVQAYPSGGGAYTVAKENLGIHYGLTAGASLMIGYVLTVAVSIAAGVAALISAFPELAEYRVSLALGGIGIITLGNLRGVRESGLLFALPTYVFLFSAFALIVVGIYRVHTAGLIVRSASVAVPAVEGLTLFLVLRTFSGGCVAMTGTEAISNAVPTFRPPESRNAATTLAWMAAILGTMFMGISYLAWRTGVVPLEHETVVSQIARATFGNTWFYLLIQFATVLILVLAANTSYAGFPWLASVMARDRFLPRQLYNLGDKLVYSNGILLLSLLAGFLVVVFRGDTHRLIPLYAVGVFLSFTLSQSGMVKHFIRTKAPGWRRSVAISGIGAMTTGVVTLVLAVARFVEGAWIVVLLIPLIWVVLWRIHAHYIMVGNQLRLTPEDRFEPLRNTVLVLLPSIHKGVMPALEYATTLSSDVRAIHVETEPDITPLLEERWEQYGGGLPLVILESPYRSLLKPLLEYLDEARQERSDRVITVIIPEFVPVKWWQKILHNQSGLAVKIALLFQRDIVVTNVRYYLQE
ncbi:MAG TPA: APC family permease [Armatimonadota bacterium]|nr:APC family permease [Armatimonadota bacterium]